MLQTTEGITSLTRRFIDQCDVTLATKKQYKAHLRQFYIWAFREKKDVRNLRRADVIEFKFCKLETLKPTTVATYLRSISLYYNWLSENKCGSNIATGIKRPKRTNKTTRRGFNINEVKVLINAIDRDTLIGKRDYTIIDLMIKYGLRRVEIYRLKIADYNPTDKSLLIKGKGKHDKEKTFLSRDSANLIDIYLSTMKNINTNRALFISLSPNNMYQQLSLIGISTIIKKRFAQAGFNSPDLCAHSLRHTTAQLLIKSGANIIEVQKHMRHSDTSTTLKYLQSLDVDRSKINMKIDNLLNP